VVVIPIARGRRPVKRPFTHNRPEPTHGIFRAPSGRPGAMTGSMRLRRLLVGSGPLRALVVFTGELVDADGSRVGVGSRRAVVPAEVTRSANGISLSIGPLDVDLLGLTVRIDAFTLEMGTADLIQSGELDRRLEGVST